METACAAPPRPTEFRFGLRTALFILTVAGLLLMPVRWFGGFYFVSMLFSTAFVIGCSVVYRASRPGALGVAFLGAFLGFAGLLGILVFFFHAVFNLIATTVLIPLKPRPRTFAAVLSAVMVATYSFCFWQGFERLGDLRILQAEYPFVSLSDRLDFEHPDTSAAAEAPQPILLASSPATHLTSQEQFFQSQPSHFSRAGALQQLHENYEAEFARAAGFGYMRMDSIYYRIVDFQPQRPLSLPAVVDLSQVPQSNSELYDIHRAAVDSFIAPDQLGYVKSRQSVVGFEAHRLNCFSSDSCSCGAHRYWQVARLELVGLLRSDEPRVYTAPTLPPMNEIAATPHRPLNAFESSALPKLVSQEDVVVDQKPERIQMLGALRAGNTCLECHEGNRGKLLGAFSYEITPIVDKNSGAAAQPQSGDGS